MAVATPPPKLQREQDFHRLLQGYQRRLAPGQTCLLSFTEPWQGGDPLTLFGALGLQEVVHFYGENGHRQERILAFGLCQSLRVSGRYRFTLAQQFAQACFEKLIPVESWEGATALPYVFCGFSFFDTSRSGSPFPNALLFLPQFQLVQSPTQSQLTYQVALTSTTALAPLVQSLCQTLALLRHPPRWSLVSAPSPPTCTPRLTQGAALAQAIAQGLGAIDQNRLQKVVLATALDVEYGQPLQVAQCLERLRHQYPDCHRFSLGNGQGDCFVGASPERLLSLRQGQLTTDALAGSAPRGTTPQQDHHWAQTLISHPKERREHQAVVAYLLERLRALGLEPQPQPLSVVKLSNIQHLWTPVHCPVPPSLSPLELVAQLHPTPAVAGVPVAIASRLIQDQETFDRGLYAAPLGWVDAAGNSEFIVGIRSALLRQSHARLYGGAGIVAGSDPLKEVAEIELKLQTLWRALA